MVLVAPPSDYTASDGSRVAAADADLYIRKDWKGQRFEWKDVVAVLSMAEDVSEKQAIYFLIDRFPLAFE